MTRIANFIGAVLFAVLCLSAVVAGAQGADASKTRLPPKACCIYLIF